MKNFIYLFGIILTISVSSCLKDSSLSDVEISDPSVIQPSISLTRSRDNAGILTTSIEVFLWDKNFNSIQLKKGKVSVNGAEMQLKKLILTGAPYYSVDTSIMKVELNKLYNFIIELSDGNTYQASITTQETDLYELNLPAGYSKSDNMPIEWKGYETNNNFQIQLECDYRLDNNAGQTSDSFTPNPQERASGTYIISKSYFNQQVGIYKATVTIESNKHGTIDPRFRTNSEISSSFEKVSECNVN